MRSSNARVLVLFLVLGPAVVRAEEPVPADLSVKQTMHRFAASLVSLMPLASTRKPFSSPTNEARIQGLLDSLATDSTGLAHLDVAKTKAMGIASGVLSDHVARTATMFRSGRRENARWMLHATIDGCIACHSQIPSMPGAFVVAVPDLPDPLMRADLLFATRRFDDAGKAYLQAIRAPGEGGVESAERAVRRVLTIELRVKRDVAGARAALEQIIPAANWNPAFSSDLKAWGQALKKPKLLPPFEPATAPAAKVLAWASARAKGDKGGVPSLLITSGVLFEFLAKNPAAAATPEVTLLLARIDRALSTDFAAPLADLLLETCIRESPKTALAKRCYAELSASITAQFTGSRGTDMPDDVTEHLAELRNLTK